MYPSQRAPVARQRPRPKAATPPTPPAELYPSTARAKPQPRLAAQGDDENRVKAQSLIEQLRQDLDAAQSRALIDSQQITQLEARCVESERKAKAAMERLAHATQQFQSRMALTTESGAAEQVQKAESERKRLDELVHVLESQLASKNQELQDTLDEWTKAREKLAMQGGVAHDDDSETEQQLRDARSEVRRLTAQLDDSNRVIEMMRLQAQDLTSNREELQQEVVELREALKEARGVADVAPEPLYQDDDQGDDGYKFKDPLPFDQVIIDAPAYEDGIAEVGFDMDAVHDTDDFIPDVTADEPEVDEPEVDEPEDDEPEPEQPKRNVRRVDMTNTGGRRSAKHIASILNAKVGKPEPEVGSEDDVQAVVSKVSSASARELKRMSVSKLTEMLNVLGKDYVKPKDTAIELLQETVSGLMKGPE